MVFLWNHLYYYLYIQLLSTPRAELLSILHFNTTLRTFLSVLCLVKTAILFGLFIGSFALFHHILDVRLLDDVADNVLGIIRLRNL